MNILSIDIDDCIFPSVVKTSYNDEDLSIETLEINLKRIKKFIENENVYIFIHSSWYSILDYWKDSMSVSLKDAYDEYFKSLEEKKDNKLDVNRQAYKLIIKYLNGRIIGIRKNDEERIESILNFDNGENKIIVIDDFDLKEIKNKNILVCVINDYISNECFMKFSYFLKS